MRVVLRVLMVVFGLSWWTAPAMGVIDLTVTWDPAWPVVLEAGWGVLFTGLGLSFVLAGVRTSLAGSALVHALAATVCLAAGAVLGLEPETWWIFAMLALQVPLLWVLARPEGPLRLGHHVPSTALAVVALPFGVAYWWAMGRHNRVEWFDRDITNGVDHYAVQAALGLLLVALPALAAHLPDARRLFGTVTALMAGYLGLVSLCWPGESAGFGQTVSIGVLTWAGAVLVAAWLPDRELNPIET